MKQKKRKCKKKFSAIAKVGVNQAGSPKFVKYRFDKMDNFLEFIQRKYGNVFYINIFSRSNQQLVYTWGKRKGLEPATRSHL